MRIALDATYSVGTNLSGVGVYSREILRGLASAHPEAEFLFCYRPHRFLRSLPERLPANCRRRLLLEAAVPRSAVLFHGLNQRLPRVKRRPVVSTFHDLFVLTGEYSTPEFRQRFAQQARDAAAGSDLILAVSDFTAREVEQLLGVERSRIRVAPHGVRMPADIPPASIREPVVLHVGAIQKRKNLVRLVRAFGILPPPWRLILAGSEGYGAAEILDAVETARYRDRIGVLGYVPDSELAKWYGRASIFAFPSLDEGFGIPVLDAMAWGIPVVTSNRSALPEVAGDAALLVDPQEEGQLAGALQELAQNEELREKLRDRGRTRAAAFKWELAVDRTWSAYRDLVGGAL